MRAASSAKRQLLVEGLQEWEAAIKARLEAAYPEETLVKMYDTVDGRTLSGLALALEPIHKAMDRIIEMYNKQVQYAILPNPRDLPPEELHLNLQGLEIPFLPPVLGLLKNITSLDISHNPLLKLPPVVCELENLHVLEAAHTAIVHVPDEIANLRKLKELYIGMNPQYGFITPEFLAKVDRRFPETVAHMTDLEVLDVSGCHFTSIPASVFTLPKLRLLDVTGNPLSAEINQQGGFRRVGEEGEASSRFARQVAPIAVEPVVVQPVQGSEPEEPSFARRVGPRPGHLAPIIEGSLEESSLNPPVAGEGEHESSQSHSRHASHAGRKLSHVERVKLESNSVAGSRYSCLCFGWSS